MSTLAKWLLIIIIGLQIHLFYAGIALALLNGSGGTALFPFGNVNLVDLQVSVFFEMILTALLWLYFAIVLLRSE